MAQLSIMKLCPLCILSNNWTKQSDEKTNIWTISSYLKRQKPSQGKGGAYTLYWSQPSGDYSDVFFWRCIPWFHTLLPIGQIIWEHFEKITGSNKTSQWILTDGNGSTVHSLGRLVGTHRRLTRSSAGRKTGGTDVCPQNHFNVIWFVHKRWDCLGYIHWYKRHKKMHRRVYR